MKNKIIFIFLLCNFILLINPSKSLGHSYDIDHYSGGDNALKVRTTSFVASDILNFTNAGDIVVTDSGIGNIGNFALTLQSSVAGTHRTIDGGGNSYGFILGSSADYVFDGINLNHFKSIEGGAIDSVAGSTLTVSNSSFSYNNLSDSSNTQTLTGGAIYNPQGNLIISNSTFTGNGAFVTVTAANNIDAEGGAIWKSSSDNPYSTNLTISNSTFDENFVSSTATENAVNAVGYGGAISDYDGIIDISSGTKFTGNYAFAKSTGVNAKANTYGGAVWAYNQAELTITDTTFDKNYAESIATKTANAYGGAICSYDNFPSPTPSKNLTFTGNYASATIKDAVDGTAEAQGGAIYNQATDLTLSDSIFTGNNVKALTENATGDVHAQGGAIYNQDNNSSISKTDFIENYALATAAGAKTAEAQGGAVNNTHAGLVISDSTFTGNYASATSVDTGGQAKAQGGAIYNDATSTLTVTNSTFKDNHVDATAAGSATAQGGAIYNDGTLKIVANGGTTSFTGNKANGASNAIYNNGTVYLNAGTGDSITFNDAVTSSANTKALNINSTAGSPTLTGGTVSFNNNVTNSAVNVANGIVNFNSAVTDSAVNISNGTANFGSNISLANDNLTISGGTSNFINQNFNTSHNISFTGGTMDLNAGNGGSSYINDEIAGSAASTININKTIAGSPTDGTVYVNNSITGGTTINVYSGTMAMGNEANLNGDNLAISGGTIDTRNNLSGTMIFNNLTFGGNANWLLDVDLAKVLADQITSTGAVLGNLNISGVKLLSDANLPSVGVLVADGSTRGHITTSLSEALGAIYRYNVSYDGASGFLNFTQNGFSPAITSGNVAQTQTFLLQTAIDRQFFGNVDAFMSFPLAQRESTICCALYSNDKNNGNAVGAACPISGNGTFSPIYSCDLNKGIWAKSFVSFENVPLINGPNVSTIEYGTLVGGDAPLRDLGHGFVGNTSVYVGYLGSNQNYDNVGVSQNGALVGIAENIVKKNAFLTLMASVGSSLGNAITPYGTDNFNSLFAGLGAKGGYNFEFKNGEYIIQPNLMLAYTFTNTFDYQTASGVSVTANPLNALQVAPGLRLIKNMKHEKGQIYLVANMVFNIMDNTRFYANDVQLPQLSIAPYFEYGIGYQRVWKERFTGFLQALARGGGRNGVALQLGLRWAI